MFYRIATRKKVETKPVEKMPGLAVATLPVIALMDDGTRAYFTDGET